MIADEGQQHTTVITRCFIDWSSPLLPRSARWIIEELFPHDDEVDLSRVTCILPGRRAARLLLDELLQLCEDRRRILIPPRLITPGALSELAVPPGTAIAAPFECLLAWVEALRATPPAELRPLTPHAPEINDLPAWLEIARDLQRLWSELAGELLTFADVPPRAQALELFAEGDRWQILQQLAHRRQAILTSLGLTDLETLDPDAASETLGHVVLVGVTDLNRRQRQLLRAAASEVTALVHAPSSLEGCLDEFGGVDSDAWAGRRFELPDARISIVDRPADQAQAALLHLAALNDRFRVDEISIGVTDDTLIEPMVRAARWAGLAVHRAEGDPMKRTAPFRFLEAAVAFLRHRTFTHLAGIVRHPDVERWLAGRMTDHPGSDLPSVLDQYHDRHLHHDLNGNWREDDRRAAVVREAVEQINALLAPLDADPRPLARWGDPVLDVLKAVYGTHATEARGVSEQSAISSCLRLRDLIDRMAASHERLQPQISAINALTLLLSEASSEMLASDVRSDEVELLGWLELLHDPAPVLVLLGVNDGSLPESVCADSFLPDGLRRVLGLRDNRQRYARDAYRLEALRHRCQELFLVCGRLDAEGDPLLPSRLLLAVEDELLPQRVLRFCDDRSEERPVDGAPLGLPRCAERAAFEAPDLPDELPIPKQMTVTEFRSYLRCPYRYALQHLLKLEEVSDQAVELDGRRFGSLLHEVLEAFGREESLLDVTDASVIEEFLLDALTRSSGSLYGVRSLPAVRLQMARAAQRLSAFARFQARMRGAGWRTRFTEVQFDERAVLDIPDDEGMPIRGKIDRIDQNERTGRWRIIDYKTGDTCRNPISEHHGRSLRPFPADPCDLAWVDLQLPLYHYLARRQKEIGGEIELCYLTLPKKASEVGIQPGPWSAAHLKHAIDRAREVVRDIRAGKFERNDDYREPFDSFARICRSTVFMEPEEETPELEEAP